MFDLLFYLVVVLYIIYIIENVKKHRKIKHHFKPIKPIIRPIKQNNTLPLYNNTNENIYSICINNKTYYFDNEVNTNISKLQTLEYNRPMFIQI